MEEILTLLEGIGRKTKCLPGHDLLNMLAPLVNGLQEIETDLTLQVGRLQSSSQQLHFEIEKEIKESGIKYVERGPLDCLCLNCLNNLVESLHQEFSDFILPASKFLEEQLQLRINHLDIHPLKREEGNQVWEKQLQHIKASPVMNTCDRIWALDDLAISMDKSYERIMVEKQELFEQINAKQKILGINEVISSSLSINALDQLLQSLDDQIRLRSGQIQQCCQVIERLWDLMNVNSKERFELFQDNLSETYYQKLEKEKQRLFEVQKEKFREMLEDQQRQLQSLWDELEMPKSKQEAFNATLQTYNAVDMLALQGELVTRLKLMADARSQIIPKIEKRQALVEKMKAFELTAKDPNRLFGPSFRLMEEDRFRKTACPSLLRLESQLESDLQSFKDRFPDDELWWQGRSFADILSEERENRYINESIFEFPTTADKPAKTSITIAINSNVKQTVKRKIV